MTQMKKFIIFLLIIVWAIYPVTATFIITPQGGPFPLSVGAEIPGSVFVDDINEDGYGEIIVETYDNLFVYNYTGSILWSKTLSRPHDKVVLKIGNPIAGDITGDTELEVITSDRVSKKLFAWNSTGSILPGFPRTLAGYAYSTPALADIDNDGSLEIAVGCDGNKLYLIEGDGSDVPGWPVNINGNIHSKPAFGDIDNDNELEIIITALDNNIYAFNLNGTTVTGWPQSISGYDVSFDYNSPTVGDIDNDGIDEVVVAATDFTIVGNLFSGKLIAFEGDGSYLWTYLTYYNAYSSPVIGNLDIDPYNEIIVGTVNNVYAIEYDGTENWVVPIGRNEVFSTPLLMDINGDGRDEIFATFNLGKILALTGDGSSFMDNSTIGKIRGSTSIHDFDNDGLPEAVVGTANGEDGYIYAWEIEFIEEKSVTSTPSGGGSGGGGGGGTGEDYKNIEVTESVLQFIVMDEKISYGFKNTDPIIKIEFIAIKNAGSINSVVEVLYNTSTQVSIPPPFIVYKNVNIYVGLYSYATEQNIKNAVVFFKVNKEWINSNEIGKSTIALYRYQDGWVQQPTEFISEDDTFIYYKTEVNGFENFAISGRKEDKKAPLITEGISKKLEDLFKSDQDPDNIEPGQSSGIDTKYLFAVLVVSILIISRIIYRKK